MIRLSVPGRCRTRMPSIVVATSSPPVNVGTSSAPGVGSGVGEGLGLGDAVGEGDGLGLGDGVGVGVASGGKVQAARTRQTATGSARTFPTGNRVAPQRSRRGTSEASRSAISRAFVVP
jgi:hypothetical protein